jgi:hypothetical protein
VIAAAQLAAESAPVTSWGPRLALTLVVLAVIGLGIWGMRRGWRARAERQSDIPAPVGPPAGASSGRAVAGQYVATTTAGDLLDRIVVHGLGNRGRADLYIRSEGVLLDRVGEPPLWIPKESLRDIRLGSGQAQKAFELGGLILITWKLGDREFDTGFRADDPAEHVATASTLSSMIPNAGGSR